MVESPTDSSRIKSTKFLPRRGPAPRVLAIILAGGEGKRLLPLTADRAKPAVPIAGRYRLIDVVLSNFVNSGLLKIKVLTQYKSDSLNTHLARGWRLPQFLDFYVEAVPAQQRTGKEWFRGSADAMYQSLNVITDEDPDFVCVFGGDHIYKMDVRQMLDFHLEVEAEATVAAIPVPIAMAKEFGVIECGADGRIRAFHEKPAKPPEMPGRPGWALASMGNYIFSTPILTGALEHDAESEGSKHDFGHNIMPHLVDRGARIYVYDFMQNIVPGQPERERGYWRDVGSIESYYNAHLDLISVHPVFDLYNARWPIRTWVRPVPPAKFVFSDEASSRMGVATDSLISEGCIVSGGRVHRSVISPNVRINSFSVVEESIILDGVNIGRRTKVRRAIIDKNVHVPPDETIGYDLEKDRRRFTVDPSGIVIVPKGFKF
jgi:glucose-1-phosphate adenylyltransferase